MSCVVAQALKTHLRPEVVWRYRI